jgi:hypothetical protein
MASLNDSAISESPDSAGEASDAPVRNSLQPASFTAEQIDVRPTFRPAFLDVATSSIKISHSIQSEHVSMESGVQNATIASLLPTQYTDGLMPVDDTANVSSSLHFYASFDALISEEKLIFGNLQVSWSHPQ